MVETLTYFRVKSVLLAIRESKSVDNPGTWSEIDISNCKKEMLTALEIEEDAENLLVNIHYHNTENEIKLYFVDYDLDFYIRYESEYVQDFKKYQLKVYFTDHLGEEYAFAYGKRTDSKAFSKKKTIINVFQYYFTIKLKQN